MAKYNYNSKTINFKVPFQTSPHVTLYWKSQNGKSLPELVQPIDISTTGFTVPSFSNTTDSSDEIYHSFDYIAVGDMETQTLTINPTPSDSNVEIDWYEPVTFTVTTSPSDANVTLTADGYTQSGNSIIVQKGTKVSYKVEKEGYTTAEGEYTLTENKSIAVEIVMNQVLFTINPTPSDAIVTLTADGYTQEGNGISVAPGTTVNYTVKDANENNPNALYAWDYNGTYIYTKSALPSVGDKIYNNNGVEITSIVIDRYSHSGMKIETVSSDGTSISIMCNVSNVPTPGPSPEPY